LDLAEGSTPYEKETETADTTKAGNVEAPAQPLERERERERRQIKNKIWDDCVGKERGEKEENFDCVGKERERVSKEEDFGRL
jgi:hypothetical protein